MGAQESSNSGRGSRDLVLLKQRRLLRDAAAARGDRAAVAIHDDAMRRLEARIAQARTRRKPMVAGHEGRFEPGLKSVDDPYEAGAQIVVAVNVRENPLEHMKARGRIDDAEYAAGVRFRRIYEDSQIGPLGAVDYSRQKVDGGRLAEPLSLKALDAQQQLKRLLESRAIVPATYVILAAVIGRGEPIASVAGVWGREVIAVGKGRARHRRSSEDIVGALVRTGLQDLAVYWGATGPNRGVIVAARELGIVLPGDIYDDRGRLIDNELDNCAVAVQE